jgi:hypothetical protein
MQSSSTRLRVAHIWREAEDITGLDLEVYCCGGSA